MSGNTKEKEKCMEKLNQMQKFLPFLDFMIDKIKKKKTEISLECQLSKLQVLRSMIAEKSERYSWDVLVKVEDIIERLISKLDFKDQYEKSKEYLLNTNNCRTVSRAFSVKNASTSRTMAGSKARDLSTDATPADDLILKTLKLSVENSLSRSTDGAKELLSNSLVSNQPPDVTEKFIETDLDKDLDGFDLTDCPNFSESEGTNGAAELVSAVTEKATFHDDLLTSSREKLLKSLQSKLLPCLPDHASSKAPTIGQSGKTSGSESQTSGSACSRIRTSLGELKTGSDFSEGGDNNSRKIVETTLKSAPFKPSKSYLSDRNQRDLGNGDANLKQRLKEKFSTDICEVYRVPGKSVGGSLRLLKEPKDHKDHKKNFHLEEEEGEDLFKPDKITEKSAPKNNGNCSSIGVSKSKTSSEKKESQSQKPHHDSSASGIERKKEKTDEKSSHKRSSGKGEKSDKKQDKSSKSRERKSKSESKSLKEAKKTLPEKESEDKTFELDKLNDEELLEFVKENMQYLPHLAKLKPAELRKAVTSTVSDNFVTLEADSIGEINNSSFQDSDEFVKVESKTPKRRKSFQLIANAEDPFAPKPHPFASVKISQVGADGVAKNVKPVVEPKKDTKLLDEVGDKTHEIDEISEGDDLNEEDYAQKLIEATTPAAVVPVKKKGLLELPMPLMDDLFEDISSIESFETENNSSDPGDPRKALSADSEGKNKSESGANSDSLQNVGFPSQHVDPHLLTDNAQRSISQIGVCSSAAPTVPPSKQNRPEPWPGKTPAGHVSQGAKQFASRQPSEPSDCVVRTTSTFPKPTSLSSNISRRSSHNLGEPKSYAEYKIMKLKKKVNLSQMKSAPEENPKGNPQDKAAFSPAEREDASKKFLDSRLSRPKDALSKQANPKSYHSGSVDDDRRKPQHSVQRKYPGHADSRSREERKSHEDAGKVDEEKRNYVDSEKLVSPLGELYPNESKPMTGRGYGLQNFKIPKKMRDSAISVKSSENQTLRNAPTEAKALVSLAQNESEPAKESKEEGRKEKSNAGNLFVEIRVEEFKSSDVKLGKSSIAAKDIATKKIIKVYSNKTFAKDVSSAAKTGAGNILRERSIMKGQDKSWEVVNSTKAQDSSGAHTKTKSTEVAGKGAKPALESDVINEMEELVHSKSAKTETTQEFLLHAEKDGVIKNEVTMAKKCEALIVECDSSVECTQVREQNSKKESTPPVEKSTTVSKEEITREFVEALIRKSFQSGEGKLLLAQAKLFEEFARKLNSKKLKTIQKIINSETESSSSTEIYSEDEKKKNKSKKSDEKNQKIKKPKKRGRKSRKYISSSASSSSSENEETSEEERVKKELPAVGSDSRTREQSEDSVPLKGGKKIKKRRRNTEFGKDFSGGRAKRKQRQKKMLEKILNESPQPETSQEISPSNSGEASAKESEPKTRRTKGKWKTELDRLHDDIRNMFLNAGEVTQTGQRMCRILRQAGGNINNMDIVKESAKMVEEEKLKKVTRSSAKNPRVGSSGSRSRSRSSDQGNKNPQPEFEEWNDPKLACEPCVALQRVDLDNFGYAVKISNDCISFKRMQGRNTAIRGTGSPWTLEVKPPNKKPVGIVFLPRNKRKVERMKLVKRKKGYLGKKLMDVVQHLPLKMAKMKHLQICENTESEKSKRRKCSVKSLKKSESVKCKPDLEFSNSELLNYAFERIRVMYSCKLCSQVTRYITGHYKVVHPDHEVLISRLCQGEAKRAKLDAKRNRYDSPQEENPLSKTIKRRMKMLLNSPNSYHCRMCSAVKTQDLELFRAHVSSHTGEFRFQCPAEGCSAQTYSRQDIKIHILTKHSKNRAEYSKVPELYTIVVEGSKMFGFLCSLCNFVQLNRDNVVDHLSRQHPASDNAKIIKINMSAYVPKAARKKHKNTENEVKDIGASRENAKVEKSEGSENAGESQSETPGERLAEKIKIGGEILVKKISSEDASPEREFRGTEGGNVNTPERKKVFLVDDEEEDEELKKSADASLDAFPINPMQEDETDEKTTEYPQKNVFNMEAEKCVDLKNNATSKESSAESQEGTNTSDRTDRESPGPCQKIKVGPLEAQLQENAIVMYECYVKGCLFFTRSFDLFEKHIKISHWKTKWNGICGICAAGKDLPESSGAENSFKLLTALRHLKLHERAKISEGKLTKEDLIVELKLGNSAEECVIDDEETDKEEKDVRSSEKTKENNEEEAKTTESADSPFPSKPLLRVRNLLGDRLSTPKESPDENEVVAISDEVVTISDEVVSIGEEPAAAEEPANSMFTIENVRSLNDAPPEESEIQIQHVCSLKDSTQPPSQPLPQPLPQPLSQPLSQLPPGKTILVRSCPTRKIAIRPETTSLPIDVGQLSVVQAPTATHPVVLSPLTSASPIRIISSALPPMPAFTVKPILVSADPAKLSAPKVLSVIAPTLSPVVTNTVVSSETITTPAPVPSENAPPTPATPKFLPDVTVIPASATSKSLPDLAVIPSSTTSKSLPDVTVIPAPGKPASPATTSNPVDVESLDEKDPVTLQRLHANPNAGNKRVKDAKIYEQMLTKTKLCHLFKCMGIECSFTCNSECVFRQHIGLHEAQRRLNRGRGVRTIFLRLANKTTRAFYWQQCSYCCELLTNTTTALSQHVLEEHGHCAYQCAFCFYRAVSQSYVEIHQNLAHIQILKTTPRVIYKCKPLRTPPSQATALERHRRRQSVRPYHCDQCGRKFFITQDFINHLTTQHQSVTAYTCHICKNLCFKADRLVVHYKLHSYCTYQCAYCLHGTETEKEMVFHLCNFHFSQPAVMYVRAFAEGQRLGVKEGQMKNKKQLSNQLESLKVVVYESDTLNADCIVEVDPSEGASENASEASLDLSDIATELGINADAQSSPSVTPLMKELASIGDKNAKNLTVKSLLPNAQFSSENENKAENCSVLISSGLSTPSDDGNEKAMNIPLGQLPVEVVSVQHSEAAPPDNNLKLNEITGNFPTKDQMEALPADEEEKKLSAAAASPAAVHKLPPVVLNRRPASKNVYSSKNAIAKKKFEDLEKIKENTEEDKSLKSNVESKDGESSKENSENAPKNESTAETDKKSSEPNEKSSEPLLITSVVSLTNSEFEKESSESENSIVISDVCSLSDKVNPDSSLVILLNTQCQINRATVLKPPIIRVDNFPVGEQSKESTEKNSTNVEPDKKDGEKKTGKPEVARPSSPDIIILDEEKSKNIIMVTLDSDEENDESTKKKADSTDENEVSKPSENETIRKEMELLRNQIASETDSLLFDDPEAEKGKSDLSLNIEPGTEDATPKSLLSPIEEAICSLNKKLQSETEQAQRKEEEEKKESEEAEKKKAEEKRRKSEEEKKRCSAEEKGEKNEEVEEKSDGADGKKEKSDGAEGKEEKNEEEEKSGGAEEKRKKSEEEEKGKKREEEEEKSDGAEEKRRKSEEEGKSDGAEEKRKSGEEEEEKSDGAEGKRRKSEEEERSDGAEEKRKKEETGEERNSEISENEVPERRRTRFATRYRRQEGRERSDKKDEDESKKGKSRKIREGLVGRDLLICGNVNCDFAADDESALKDHLFVCDLSRETAGMTCPHCTKQTKHMNPASYLDHLQCHGEKKHHCGLCEYSSVDSSVTRHVKLKHKCITLKALPKDSRPGHLWYYPKNYKVDKVDFEVNGYSPGDEDKLPLQSVYQVNVKCAKCPYFTKVRSNMVRHLKIHLKSVETEGGVVVPSTAPTNPVPCLETKERMFDKMTNLAASSQLAQAKEKTAIESLSPEEEAKLPQFVAEQLRYKCCLADCNYITVDEGMLKHHIKALHDEINYYSCPHCRDTVHVDVRHVTLDKIGHHLKHHDAKLYKCPHCIYFHYQKNVVEKHTAEKHPDRRYFVHAVREPKPETPADDEDSSSEGGGPRVWKCALCENFRSPCKATVKDHLLKSHNIKSKYRCKLCPMKGNNYGAFCSHFSSKHPGEKVSYIKVCLSEKVGAGCLESGNSSGADSSSEHFDTTPLWQRGTPRIRHIRGILIEEEEIKTKKSKKVSLEENETETPECATANDKNLFYCPLCTNKKKPFFTRNEEFFRTHLYQELNYQQFACILCGKMFVDKKDFYRHHARVHRDKAPALKRTKEDHEIKFWVDKVIARRLQQLEERKRKLSSDEEASGSQGPPKKKKED